MFNSGGKSSSNSEPRKALEIAPTCPSKLTFISLATIRKDMNKSKVDVDIDVLRRASPVILHASSYYSASSETTSKLFQLPSDVSRYSADDVRELAQMTGFNEYLVHFHMEKVLSSSSSLLSSSPSSSIPRKQLGVQGMGIHNSKFQQQVLLSVYNDLLEFLHLGITLADHFSLGLESKDKNSDASSSSSSSSPVFDLMNESIKLTQRQTISTNDVAKPLYLTLYTELLALLEMLSSSIAISDSMLQAHTACNWLSVLFDHRVIAQSLLLTALSRLVSRRFDSTSGDMSISRAFQPCFQFIMMLALSTHFGTQQQASTYLSSSCGSLLTAFPSYFYTIVTSLIDVHHTSYIISIWQQEYAQWQMTSSRSKQPFRRSDHLIRLLGDYGTNTPLCNSDTTLTFLSNVLDELLVYTPSHPAYSVVIVLFLVAAIHISNHLTVSEQAYEVLQQNHIAIERSPDAIRRLEQIVKNTDVWMQTVAQHLSVAFESGALTFLLELGLKSAPTSSIFPALPVFTAAIHPHGTDLPVMNVETIYRYTTLQCCVTVVLALFQSTCFYAALKHNLFNVLTPLMTLFLSSMLSYGDERKQRSTRSSHIRSISSIASRCFGPSIFNHYKTTNTTLDHEQEEAMYTDILEFISTPQSILYYLLASFPLIYVQETLSIFALLSAHYCDVVQRILEQRTSLTTLIPLDFIKIVKPNAKKSSQHDVSSPDLDFKAGQRIMNTVDFCVDSVLTIPAGTKGVLTTVDFPGQNSFMAITHTRDIVLSRQLQREGVAARASTSAKSASPTYKLESGSTSSTQDIDIGGTDNLVVVVWHLQWDALSYLLHKLVGTPSLVFKTPFNPSGQTNGDVSGLNHTMYGELPEIATPSPDPERSGVDTDAYGNAYPYDHLGLISLFSAKRLLKANLPHASVVPSVGSYERAVAALKSPHSAAWHNHRLLSGEVLLLLSHIYGFHEVDSRWVTPTIHLCLDSLLSRLVPQESIDITPLSGTRGNGQSTINNTSLGSVNSTRLLQPEDSLYLQQSLPFMGESVMLMMSITAITIDDPETLSSVPLSSSSSTSDHQNNPLTLLDRFDKSLHPITVRTHTYTYSAVATSMTTLPLFATSPVSLLNSTANAFDSTMTSNVTGVDRSALYTTSLLSNTLANTSDGIGPRTIANASLSKSFALSQERQYVAAMVSLLQLSCTTYTQLTANLLMSISSLQMVQLPAAKSTPMTSISSSSSSFILPPSTAYNTIPGMLQVPIATTSPSTSAFPTEFFVALLTLATRIGTVTTYTANHMNLPSMVIHSVGTLAQFSSTFTSLTLPSSSPSSPIASLNQSLIQHDNTSLVNLTKNSSLSVHNHTITNAPVPRPSRSLTEVPLLATPTTLHSLVRVLFSSHRYFTQKTSTYISSISSSGNLVSPSALLDVFTTRDTVTIKGLHEALTTRPLHAIQPVVSLLNAGVGTSTHAVIEQLHSLLLLAPHVLFQIEHHGGSSRKQLQAVIATTPTEWTEKDRSVIRTFWQSRFGTHLNGVSLSHILQDFHISMHYFTLMACSVGTYQSRRLARSPTSAKPSLLPYSIHKSFTTISASAGMSITFLSTLVTHARSIVSQCIAGLSHAEIASNLTRVFSIPTSTADGLHNTVNTSGNAQRIPQYLSFPLVLLTSLLDSRCVDAILSCMELASFSLTHHPIFTKAMQFIIDILLLQQDIRSNAFYCELLLISVPNGADGEYDGQFGPGVTSGTSGGTTAPGSTTASTSTAATAVIGGSTSQPSSNASTMFLGRSTPSMSGRPGRGDVPNLMISDSNIITSGNNTSLDYTVGTNSNPQPANSAVALIGHHHHHDATRSAHDVYQDQGLRPHSQVLSGTHPSRLLTSTSTLNAICQMVSLSLFSLTNQIKDGIDEVAKINNDGDDDNTVSDIKQSKRQRHHLYKSIREHIRHAWLVLSLVLSLREVLPEAALGTFLSTHLLKPAAAKIHSPGTSDNDDDQSITFADVVILSFTTLYRCHRQMTDPQHGLDRYPHALCLQLARITNTAGAILAAQIRTGRCHTIAETLSLWEAIGEILTQYPTLYTKHARVGTTKSLSLMKQIEMMPHHTSDLNHYISPAIQWFLVIETALGLLHAVIACPPRRSSTISTSGNKSNAENTTGDTSNEDENDENSQTDPDGAITHPHIITILSSINLSQLTRVVSHVCALPAPSHHIQSIVHEADALLRFSPFDADNNDTNGFRSTHLNMSSIHIPQSQSQSGSYRFANHTTTSSSLFLNTPCDYLYIYHPDSYFSRFILAYVKQFHLLTSPSLMGDVYSTSGNTTFLSPRQMHNESLSSSPLLVSPSLSLSPSPSSSLPSSPEDRFSWAEWLLSKSHHSLHQFPHAITMLQAYSAAIHHSALFTTHIRAINSMPGAQQQLSILPIAKTALRHFWSGRMHASQFAGNSLDDDNDDDSNSGHSQIDTFILGDIHSEGDEDEDGTSMGSNSQVDSRPDYILPSELLPLFTSLTTDGPLMDDNIDSGNDDDDSNSTTSNANATLRTNTHSTSPLASFITSHLLTLLFSSIQSHFDLNQVSSSLFSSSHTKLLTSGSYTLIGDSTDLTYMESVNQTTHLLSSMLTVLCAASGLSSTLPVSPSLFVDIGFLKQCQQSSDHDNNSHTEDDDALQTLVDLGEDFTSGNTSFDASMFAKPSPSGPSRDLIYEIPPINELRRCIDSALSGIQCSLEEVTLDAMDRNIIDYSFAEIDQVKRAYHTDHNGGDGDDDDDDINSDKMLHAPSLTDLLLRMQLTVPNTIDSLSQLLHGAFDAFVSKNQTSYSFHQLYEEMFHTLHQDSSYSSNTTAGSASSGSHTSSSTPVSSMFDVSSSSGSRPYVSTLHTPATADAIFARLRSTPSYLYTYTLRQIVSDQAELYETTGAIGMDDKQPQTDLDPFHGGVNNVRLTANEVSANGESYITSGAADAPNTVPLTSRLLSLLMPLALLINQMVLLADKRTQIMLSASSSATIKTCFNSKMSTSEHLSAETPLRGTKGHSGSNSSYTPLPSLPDANTSTSSSTETELLQSDCLLCSLAMESSNATVSASLVPALIQCLYVPSLVDTVLPLLSAVLRCVSSQVTFAQTVFNKQIQEHSRVHNRDNTDDDDGDDDYPTTVYDALMETSCQQSLRTLYALKNDVFLEVTYQLPYLLALIRACPPEACHRLSTLMSILDQVHSHNTVNPQPSAIFTTGEDLPFDAFSTSILSPQLLSGDDAAHNNQFDLSMSVLHPDNNPKASKIFERLHPILYTATSPVSTATSILPCLAHQPVFRDLNTLYGILYHQGNASSAGFSHAQFVFTYPLSALLEYAFDLGDINNPSLYPRQTALSKVLLDSYRSSPRSADKTRSVDDIDGGKALENALENAFDIDHDALTDHYQHLSRYRWSFIFSSMIRFQTNLFSCVINGLNQLLDNTDHPHIDLHNTTLHSNSVSYNSTLSSNASQHHHDQSTLNTTFNSSFAGNNNQSKKTSSRTSGTKSPLLSLLPVFFNIFDTYPSLFIHFTSFIHGEYGSNSANILTYLSRLDASYPLWRLYYITSHASRNTQMMAATSPLSSLYTISTAGDHSHEGKFINPSHYFLSLLHRKSLRLVVLFYDHQRSIQRRQQSLDRRRREKKFYRSQPTSAAGRRGSAVSDDLFRDADGPASDSNNAGRNTPYFDGMSSPPGLQATPTLPAVSSSESHPSLTARGTSSVSISHNITVYEATDDENAIQTVRTHDSLFKYRQSSSQHVLESFSISRSTAPPRQPSALSQTQLGLTFTFLSPLMHYIATYTSSAVILQKRLQSMAKDSTSFMPWDDINETNGSNGGIRSSFTAPETLITIDGFRAPLFVLYSLYYLPFSFSFDRLRVNLTTSGFVQRTSSASNSPTNTTSNGQPTLSGSSSHASAGGTVSTSTTSSIQTQTLHRSTNKMSKLASLLPTTSFLQKTSAQNLPLHPLDFYLYTVLLYKLSWQDDSYDPSAAQLLQSFISQKVVPDDQIPLVYLFFLAEYNASLLQLLVPSEQALCKLYGQSGKSILRRGGDSGAPSQTTLSSGHTSHHTKPSPFISTLSGTPATSSTLSSAPSANRGVKYAKTSKRPASLNRIISPLRPQTVQVTPPSQQYLHLVRQFIRDVNIGDRSCADDVLDHSPSSQPHALDSISALSSGSKYGSDGLTSTYAPVITNEDYNWRNALLHGKTNGDINVYAQLQRSNELMASSILASIYEVNAQHFENIAFSGDNATLESSASAAASIPNKQPLFLSICQTKNVYEQIWLLISFHISALLSLDKGFSLFALLTPMKIDEFSSYGHSQAQSTANTGGLTQFMLTNNLPESDIEGMRMASGISSFFHFAHISYKRLVTQIPSVSRPLNLLANSTGSGLPSALSRTQSSTNTNQPGTKQHGTSTVSPAYQHICPLLIPISHKQQHLINSLEKIVMKVKHASTIRSRYGLTPEMVFNLQLEIPTSTYFDAIKQAAMYVHHRNHPSSSYSAVPPYLSPNGLPSPSLSHTNSHEYDQDSTMHDISTTPQLSTESKSQYPYYTSTISSSVRGSPHTAAEMMPNRTDNAGSGSSPPAIFLSSFANKMDVGLDTLDRCLLYTDLKIKQYERIVDRVMACMNCHEHIIAGSFTNNYFIGRPGGLSSTTSGNTTGQQAPTTTGIGNPRLNAASPQQSTTTTTTTISQPGSNNNTTTTTTGEAPTVLSLWLSPPLPQRMFRLTSTHGAGFLNTMLTNVQNHILQIKSKIHNLEIIRSIIVAMLAECVQLKKGAIRRD